MSILGVSLEAFQNQDIKRMLFSKLIMDQIISTKIKVLHSSASLISLLCSKKGMKTLSGNRIHLHKFKD